MMNAHEEDKELLDRIRTREELERRGYTRKRCEKCNSLGHVSMPWKDDGLHECPACKGRGFTWDAPLMR